MPTFPLTHSASAVADTDGVAKASVGPEYAFEKWHITSVSIESDSSTLVPQLKEYRGGAGGQLLGSSRSGDLDSGGADINLQPGEIVTYEWTNCDVGASCKVTVNGTRQRP